jgi:hypothetical protein
MICPAGRFVPPDILSRRTFCPAGRFVPPDVLSTDFLSPDVLSGHLKFGSGAGFGDPQCLGTKTFLKTCHWYIFVDEDRRKSKILHHI